MKAHERRKKEPGRKRRSTRNMSYKLHEEKSTMKMKATRDAEQREKKEKEQDGRKGIFVFVCANTPKTAGIASFRILFECSSLLHQNGSHEKYKIQQQYQKCCSKI